MTQTASRYRLVNPPGPALPGECFICRSPHDDVGFVDTARDAEFHGAVYICASRCLAEMARLVGYLTPDQAGQLAQERDQLAEQLKISRARLDAFSHLQEVIVSTGLVGVHANRPDDGGDGTDGAGGGVDRQPDSGGADQDGGDPVRPAARRGRRRVAAEDGPAAGL